MKFILKRLPEIVIYYLSFKKYYLCDACREIHKRNNSDIELNHKYGLFVSQECSDKVIEKACNIMTQAIRKAITR